MIYLLLNGLSKLDYFSCLLRNTVLRIVIDDFGSYAFDYTLTDLSTILRFKRREFYGFKATGFDILLLSAIPSSNYFGELSDDSSNILSLVKSMGSRDFSSN